MIECEKMRPEPGIEPESPAPETDILPLDHTGFTGWTTKLLLMSKIKAGSHS